MSRYAILSMGRYRLEFPTALACLLASIAIPDPVSHVHAQDLAADRAALVALYNATGGPNWNTTIQTG